MAACALRRGIRTVPIAQQQHPDRLGPARTERFGERHAGHRTPRGTNDRRRADGPAVPRRARKQHPHGPAAGGRIRRRRGRRQPRAHPPAPARRAEEN